MTSVNPTNLLAYDYENRLTQTSFTGRDEHFINTTARATGCLPTAAAWFRVTFWTGTARLRRCWRKRIPAETSFTITSTASA